MSVLQEFELAAIEILAGDVLTPPQLDLLRHAEKLDNYDYTGGGYFLTIKDARLPSESMVLSEPAVVGNAGEVQAGFVVFLGDHELVLECHTWGPVHVPPDFRRLDVTISTPSVNVVDLR